MKDDRKQFAHERMARICAQGKNRKLTRLADAFLVEASRVKYTYNFSWLGIPIFQHPEDLIALQDIIWKVKPEVVVDVGTARGGSAIFYASLLRLLGGGRVISVDIDLRPHNRDTIVGHRLGKFVSLIHGSSTDPKTVATLKKLIGSSRPVLVALDTLHTEAQVFSELTLYAPLVTKGSYIIACDTVLKKLPRRTYPLDHAARPWGPRNNPATAVKKFLAAHRNFIADTAIDSQLLISTTPGGYLKRIR